MIVLRRALSRACTLAASGRAEGPLGELLTDYLTCRATTLFQRGSRQRSLTT